MERILCTNGKRDDYFDATVAKSPQFTKKTKWWIKEEAIAPPVQIKNTKKVAELIAPVETKNFESL